MGSIRHDDRKRGLQYLWIGVQNISEEGCKISLEILKFPEKGADLSNERRVRNLQVQV